MLPFWSKNNESKNSSADGAFASLILLAVSLEAINNIAAKAECISKPPFSVMDGIDRF